MIVRRWIRNSNSDANFARIKDTLQTIVTSRMKIPAPIAGDTTMKPKIAGTRTSQSWKRKTKGKQTLANMPETRRLMLQIATHNT